LAAFAGKKNISFRKLGFTLGYYVTHFTQRTPGSGFLFISHVTLSTLCTHHWPSPLFKDVLFCYSMQVFFPLF